MNQLNLFIITIFCVVCHLFSFVNMYRILNFAGSHGKPSSHRFIINSKSQTSTIRTNTNIFTKSSKFPHVFSHRSLKSCSDDTKIAIQGNLMQSIKDPAQIVFDDNDIGSGSEINEVILSDKSQKMNFYSISDIDLQYLLTSWNQPKFRVEQIRKWVYDKGVTDFESMLDLPSSLRKQLSEVFTIGVLKLASEQISKDGTVKRAYELFDGQLIESVLMPYSDGRFTACISSQAGCGMGCVFCATGQMGFARQLTSTEIFEQAQRFSAELKSRNARLSNIVFMGMGEPLANYNNVLEAVNRFNSELGIGMRHLTISTVGLAPRIRKLADSELQVGLAISLHQATNEKRSALMPVNNRFPVEELLDACRYYISKTNRRISFEWALINGQTDTPASAHELGKLLKGMLCHVNVIPLNPTKGFPGKPTQKAGVDEFIRILGEYGVTATARVRRGIDIDAGCGQLKADLIRKRQTNKAVDENLV